MGTIYQVTEGRGTLPVRMTGANILLISTPEDGLHVKNTDDDITYEYDTTRAEWLSVESTAFQWSGVGITDNEYLSIGGNMGNGGSGAWMPLDAVIVRSSGTSSAGNITKGFDIMIDGLIDTSFNFTTNSYINNALNISIDAGQGLNVFCQATGAFVTNPMIALWVKWRL